MTKLIQHMRAHFIQWCALAVLLAAMAAPSRAAVVPVLWSLGRFILPFLVIWFLYRVAKSRLEMAVKKFQDQMMQNIQNPGQGYASGRTHGGTGGAQVLDLCPKCGSLQTAGHVCKK